MIRRSWLALLFFASPPSPAAPKLAVPRALVGHYHGVDARAEEGFPLADAQVDFYLDENGLTLSEFTPAGRRWRVHYPPSWLGIEYAPAGAPSVVVRESAHARDTIWRLRFPDLSRWSDRLVGLSSPTDPLLSVATFVRAGDGTRELLERNYAQRFARRTFGPHRDPRWREIDLGAARDAMTRGRREDRLRTVAEAIDGLADQPAGERIHRKYVLALALNGDDPEVALTTLRALARHAPVRPAAALLRERLHGRVSPAFAAAALDLAERLVDEARRFREPFDALFSEFGTDDPAEVHARTNGRVTPRVMRAIRRAEGFTPEIEQWSEDDRLELVELLGRYAKDSGAPAAFRQRARALARRLWNSSPAAKCGAGLTATLGKS